MLCTTGSSADRLRSLKTRGERRMDEFLGQVEQQQAGQTAGQSHGNIVAVQRPKMEQLARRWEENDAGKARGRGRDYPPQRRVWPCERGKYRSAKRTIDEDEAEIGRDQRREGKGARIRFRQALAERHDEEAGDQRQDEGSLQQAPGNETGGEEALGRLTWRPAHSVGLLALGFEHD